MFLLLSSTANADDAGIPCCRRSLVLVASTDHHSRTFERAEFMTLRCRLSSGQTGEARAGDNLSVANALATFGGVDYGRSSVILPAKPCVTLGKTRLRREYASARACGHRGNL